MKKKIVVIMSIITLVLFGITIYIARNKSLYKIDLNNLTFAENNEIENIKTYSIKDFESFLDDYNNNRLPMVYITKFLFDGVSMYKPYDLDNFIDNGNNYALNYFEITNINFHQVGRYELVGKIDNAMLSINTNDLQGKVSLLLNNVNIDTKSKKVPVIYVYNKDINYTDAKVFINTISNSKNYLEGGKLKKVSLISKEELESYANKYTGENKNNYELYNNYYGIYTKEEINKILFAKVEADKDDLQDGDPYYFYKGAGAISSDIDLYFEGDGLLEVNSKNDEGIETKGNLALIGGKGDYVVKSYDDALNTTTKNIINDARNTIVVDVKSLYAFVSNDADEGDAIDSNGEIYINGGKIIALSRPGNDSGLDSEKGTYINGGEVIATGDMLDDIRKESAQKVMVLSFNDGLKSGNSIALSIKNGSLIFAFKTDRVCQNLVYSSSKLNNDIYYLYNVDYVNGFEENGLYHEISSLNGAKQLGYAMKGKIERKHNIDMLNDSSDSINNQTFDKNEKNNVRPPMDRKDSFNGSDVSLNSDFVINDTVNIFSGIDLINK